MPQDGSAAKAFDARRGAADWGEHREAAEAIVVTVWWKAEVAGARSNRRQCATADPLFQSGAIYWWREASIGHIELLQRQFAKHVGIANAALSKFDDFLGDKSCRRIITNFQMQRLAGRYQGSGHIFDGFRVKSLTSKKVSDRHDIHLAITGGSTTGLTGTRYPR